MRFSAAKMAARFLAVVLSSAAASAETNLAWADEVDAAIQRVVSIDQRVHIMALEFNAAPADATEVAIRRVVDAEGLLRLGRADEATTVLLSVALRRPGTLEARDATFLIGDALFQLGDERLARRYYEEALSTFKGTTRERQALIRLIEIALATRDFDHVDRYLGLLEQSPKDGHPADDPAVSYLKAKILYQRGDLDGALRMFGSVPPASVYASRARYFAATILVQKGDLDAASRGYETLLAAAGSDAVARQVRDLAQLALARIRHKQGRHESAAAGYSAISPDSKSFPEALYELGWTHVAAKNFDEAHEAFGRLLRAQPHGPRAPELKLLLANLDLRQGRFSAARTAFSSSLDELQPTYDKLRAVIVQSQADPAFLDALTSRSHDELDLGAFIPISARSWVRTDPEVDRLLRLANDVVVSQRMAADAGNMLERIESVVADNAGRDPLELFLDLRRTRQTSNHLFVELAAMRERFTGRARRLEAPHLEPAQATRLQRIDAERAGIESQLGVPSKLDVMPVDDARSHAIAPESREAVGILRALVLRLEGPTSTRRFGIAEAMRAADPVMLSGARERAVAEQLQRLSDEEQQIEQDLLERLGPADRKRIDRELGVASRAAAVMAQLFDLDDRVHNEAQARATSLQRLVAERRHDMAVTNGKLATVVRDTRDLGDALVRVMYTRVADRLYDLLVRADVGLIDVAWADKEHSVAAWRTLTNEKQREKNALEQELMRQYQALDARLKRAVQLRKSVKAD
jgi:TolA-binding protein